MSLLLSFWRNVVRDLSRVTIPFKRAWDRPLTASTLLVILVLLVWFVAWIVSTGGTGFTFQASGTERTRTLWDWFGLLLIPLILASGGVGFNLLSNRRAEAEANKDRDIAEDRNREQNLRNFINTIQDLVALPSPDLDSNDRLKQVARAQAIATMKTLDSTRLGQVITILIDTGLLSYVEDDDEAGGIESGDDDESDLTSSAEGQDPNEIVGTIRDEPNEGGALQPLFAFEDADFRSVNWSRANLRRVNLGSVLLDNADLRLAYMEHTRFNEASLSGANLEAAYLVDVDFSGAKLDEVNFDKAVLENCVLCNATFEKATFKAADLTGADFSGADELTPKQLNAADRLVGVTLPDGTKIPDHTNEENPPHYVVERSGNIWSFRIRHRYFGR